MTVRAQSQTLALRPDRRWLTKQYLVLATFTALIAGVVGIVHLIVSLTVDAPDREGVLSLMWVITGGVTLAMWLIAVPIVILWHRNLDYAVEPERIVIRKGLLSKIQQNIPLGMITDFRLHRSLYDRWLGIGSIQVQTAGQAMAATGYEGTLAGLEDWAELHEDLRNRVRGTSQRDDDPEVDLAAILDEVRGIRKALESSR